MWNGKKKAVTFSYDDGIEMDRKLVALFNKYGVKGTFNLNSGIQSGGSKWVNKDVEIKRLNIAELPEIYKGHEIAVHCLTHASLPSLDEDSKYNEVQVDKENLERIFGIKIQGMAYPYGTYDDASVAVLEKCGIKYARTVESSHDFKLQTDLLRFKPTCHHEDDRVFELIDEFLALDEKALEENGPAVLYIWGHSYEFAVNDNWERMEKILEKLSGREDIFYGTNAEVLL